MWSSGFAEKPARARAARGGDPEWAAWLLLIVVIALIAVIRLRLAPVPFERDEGEYAYAGQLILDGIAPYQLAYNMKLPGTYLAYAALMSVFGQTAAGIHLGFTVVHLGTLALLYAVGRALFGHIGASVATSSFAVMTLSPALGWLAAHATHFVLPPALGGTWLLLRQAQQQSRWGSFAAGLLFGTALLMKQHAALLGIFGAAFLAYLHLCARSRDWHRAASAVGLYCVGAVLPYVAVCLWLYLEGVFPRFWFWTFEYAGRYASLVPAEQGWVAAKAGFARLFEAAPGLWCLAGLGVMLAPVVQIDAWKRVFLLGFLLFSFLAVCPGLYFRSHYFVVMMPAVALSIALAVWWATNALARTGRASALRYLPIAIALAACAQSVHTNRDVLITLPLERSVRAVYGTNPFIESAEIARYIEAHSGEDDRIAVLGSEPEIYFYAKRRSATGYIYMYPLMEPQPFALKMQADMIREIEQSRPAYVVFVSTPVSWLWTPTSHTLLVRWFDDYSARELEPVGVIRAGPDTTLRLLAPQTEWPGDGRDVVMLFKRKTRE